MKSIGVKRKLIVAATTVVLLAGVVTATAFAAADAGVTLTGDTLSGGDVTFSDFAGVTLNGQQQTTNATWDIADVIDDRGTGDGWNLSLTLTQLKEYDTDYVPGGRSIPSGSITVDTSPVVALVDGTSSPAGTITPVSASTPLDTGTPVKILSAATDGGMGSYSFSGMTAALAVRADAYAAVYKTDATVSISTGP